MELQRMLDGKLVPVAMHRDDIIETKDGEFIRYGDIKYVDCKGNVFSDEDERDDADADIVAELLDARDEWIGEYVASSDYGDDYAYLVCEDKCRWADSIKEWLCDKYSDCDRYSSRSMFDGNVGNDGDLESSLIDRMIDKLDHYELEAHYQDNEYACYHGGGCAIDSFEVGEYEDQIDVNDCAEFKELADQGRLADALGRYNGDLYINYDERHLSGRYPHFYGYSCGWGRWHYVFSDESMERALCAAIIDYCERADGGKFGK